MEYREVREFWRGLYQAKAVYFAAVARGLSPPAGTSA
jgi:hypothetical protein